MLKKIEIEKPQDFLDTCEAKSKEFLYHDHPNEGIDYFNDTVLEDIGWHVNAFGITYRDIAEHIEENCEGTLTFNDHTLGFNGFVEIEDIEDVRVKVKQFAIDSIKAKNISELDGDQEEALEFFGLK